SPLRRDGRASRRCRGALSGNLGRLRRDAGRNRVLARPHRPPARPTALHARRRRLARRAPGTVIRALAAALLLLLGATGAVHAGYAPQAEIDAAMRAAAVEAKAYGDEHSLIAGLQWAQARSVTDPL